MGVRVRSSSKTFNMRGLNIMDLAKYIDTILLFSLFATFLVFWPRRFASSSECISPKPLLLTSIFTGILTVATIAFAIYTFLKTAAISEVPIYVQHKLHRTEYKATFLFVFPSFIAFLFIVSVYQCLRWEKFKRKIVEQQEAARIRGDVTGQINFETLNKLVAIGWCFMAAVLTNQAIQRCYALLSGEP